MSEELDDAAAVNSGGTLRLVIAGVVVSAIIAGGVFAAWWFNEPEMDPTLVLVIPAGGVHEHFDGPFTDAFVRQLSEHGFDVISDTEALTATEPEAAFAEARARAYEARAASVVLLDVGAEDERPGILAGEHLFRAHLAAHVIPTEESDPVISNESEFAFEGTSALDIASAVQRTWLSTVGPDTIDALYRVDAVRDLTERHHDLSLDRMQFGLPLREKLALVQARRDRVEEFERSCTLAREEMNDIANSEDGVSCIGDPCRPWSAIGIAADGQTAFVHEHYREPIFELMDSGRVRWTEPPEAVRAVALEGDAEPRTMLRVGHFYGLASMRQGGHSIAASFFGSGVPAVVTIDTETGDWQQRWLLEGRERVHRREPSPDGESVLVYQRQAGWALLTEQGTVVMPSFREASLVEFPDSIVRIVGALESAELTVVGLDAAPEDVREPIPGRVDDIAGTRDGQLDILVRQDGGCMLMRFDLAARTLGDAIPLPVCIDQPQTLPDGRLIGTARWSAPGDAPGDLEIVVVDPRDASVVGLTRNQQRDELPHVSADGSRVAFSRRIGDWPANYDVELYRRVLCVAEIPSAATIE